MVGQAFQPDGRGTGVRLESLTYGPGLDTLAALAHPHSVGRPGGPARGRARRVMIITIDGPAGAGKSSAAKALARRLGFDFLDTGAMYRAVALAALEAGLDLRDQEALAALLAG